jgi:hypothetical protein
LCLTVGCGGGGPELVPVEGKVLYNGQPLEFGSVMFQPANGPMARGQIEPDGTFTLETGDDTGAVVGKHQVRITCFETQRPGAQLEMTDGGEPGVGKSLIPRKYTSLATSQISVDVTPDQEPIVIELTD